LPLLRYLIGDWHFFFLLYYRSHLISPISKFLFININIK
jgi:hypothetical protein